MLDWHPCFLPDDLRKRLGEYQKMTDREIEARERGTIANAQPEPPEDVAPEPESADSP
jgi:hypothetical protein